MAYNHLPRSPRHAPSRTERHQVPTITGVWYWCVPPIACLNQLEKIAWERQCTVVTVSCLHAAIQAL